MLAKSWGPVEVVPSFTRSHHSSSAAAQSLPVACGMRSARGEAAELSLCHSAELGISGHPEPLHNQGCCEDKTAALTPSSPFLQGSALLLLLLTFVAVLVAVLVAQEVASYVLI